MSELIEAMRKKHDELWQAYLHGPGGHTETLRQGKFEGYDMALREVLAAERVQGEAGEVAE